MFDSRITCVMFVGACMVSACDERQPPSDARVDGYFATPLTFVPGTRVFSADSTLVAYDSVTTRDSYSVRVMEVKAGTSVELAHIAEADPGSGRSHFTVWSADGKALLIGGAGQVNGDKSKKLCLGYILAEKTLFRAKSCR